MIPIAHINGGRQQSLSAHLTNVSRLARSFEGSDAAMGHLVGAFHDLGKSSDAFQRYICGESFHRVPHACVGARYLLQAATAKTRWQANIAALVVAGHHGGLRDLQDFQARMTKANATKCLTAMPESVQLPKLPDFEQLPLLQSITALPNGSVEQMAAVMLYTRMLFSCLVDADYLDAAAFMRMEEVREEAPLLEKLWESVEMQDVHYGHPATTLDERRTQILRACLDVAGRTEDAVFTLTVPTGGGKTFASLAFAMRLALRCGMKRIIYVIPYTSITLQTAEVFRKIFGEGVVLEDHCQVAWKSKEAEEKVCWQQLAAENWDTSIVVTTSNQFFESLYANRPNKCRKLHNIAHSVLIFDEAQMLPMLLLRPAMDAVRELVTRYGCAAVFCTATQPMLSSFFDRMTEIAPQTYARDEVFRRCRFVREDGVLTPLEVATRMQKHGQSLAVFNGKASVAKAFDELPAESRFYLTTNLCPAHRKAVLRRIRQRLHEGMPCHVVSTSLVEAGVDLDFGSVWREEAGLDHVIQAGGRCNREGERNADDSLVHVFSLGKFPRNRPDLQQQAQLLRIVWEAYPDAIDSPEAIQLYFRKLFQFNETDAFEIQNLLKKYPLPFEQVAKAFRIIHEEKRPVLILSAGTDAERQRLGSVASAIREGHATRKMFRLARQYTVDVYTSAYEALLADGSAEEIMDGYAVLRNDSRYDEEKGLIV